MKSICKLVNRIHAWVFSSSFVGAVESIKLYDFRSDGVYFYESFLRGYNLFNDYDPIAAGLIMRNVKSVYNGSAIFRVDVRFIRKDNSIQLNFPDTRDSEVDSVFVALSLAAVHNRICNEDYKNGNSIDSEELRILSMVDLTSYLQRVTGVRACDMIEE